MEFINTYKDPWHMLGNEDGPPVSIRPAPNLLLDLTQWRAFKSQWPHDMPVGVRIGNDVDVEELVADLPRMGLVALCFPKWVDGRAYSQARLLRMRYRFKAELRATGEVLVDMLPLLQRSGFSSVALRADQSLEAAQRALTFFPGYYQGDAQDSLPLFAKPAGTAEALARAATQHDFLNDGAAI
jgi:uncharacterized protein (DUF934 family)